MYQLDKYKKSNGECPFNDFVQELVNNGCKKELMQLQIYTKLLQEHGFRLPIINKNYAKNLNDGLNELRPGPNRIFYFHCQKNDKYVLLHGFRKKGQKTPDKEINRAMREKLDYEKQNSSN